MRPHGQVRPLDSDRERPDLLTAWRISLVSSSRKRIVITSGRTLSFAFGGLPIFFFTIEISQQRRFRNTRTQIRTPPMKEFSSAVVSAVPSGSEHDLAGSRRNALRTMHATAIFDSIAVSRWSTDSLGPDFADWFLVCEISGLPIWGFVRRVVSSGVNRAFSANGFWVP
jgi:hypothetical protein